MTKTARAFYLAVLLLVAAWHAPTDAQQVKRWAVVAGSPCCGAPAHFNRYLDANEACQKEITLGNPPPCWIEHPGTLVAAGGPNPAGGAAACVHLTTCVCGNCIIGFPGHPSNTKWTGTGANAIADFLPCPAGQVLYLGRCQADPAKTKGVCTDCDSSWANPANVGSGNKYQGEVIYRSATLELVLYYNSQVGGSYFDSGAFGSRWSSRYFLRLRDSGQNIVALDRPDGREIEFRRVGTTNAWLGDPDVSDRVEGILDAAGNQTGWRVRSAEGDRVEEHSGWGGYWRGNMGSIQRIIDRAGLQHTMTYATPPAFDVPMPTPLLAVTDPYGRQLNFTYDTKNRVVTMTDPAGGAYAFEYDGPSGPVGANNLTKVTFPGGATRVYFYAEPANINGGAACPAPLAGRSNLLTGIQDENGVRFATWTYDCENRVTGSQHAAGADTHTFAYGANDRTVIDPRGVTRTIPVQRLLGVAKPTGVTQPAASGSGTVSRSSTYDASNNPASRTDFNGNLTNYTYDLSRNLETFRTEAFGTQQARTINTQWHPVFRLPIAIAEPLRITTNVYDPDGAACGARGALCSRSVQATGDASGAMGFTAPASGAPRVTTFTYNANGSVLTVNGPRTDAADLTTYTYYPNNDVDLGKRGNVATVTNALGHTTSITAYNAHGQPLTILDANGLTTTLVYDARLRLTSRSVGSETTAYTYDSVGQLTRVTLPDGSFLEYDYDDAHRLTGISDNLGNRIAYMLDVMGNRTQEQVFDPANALAQTRSREYDSLNRLLREVGAQSQATEYGYDNQGNVISVKDPLNKVTANQYDALNRLRQVTDPGLGVTQYAYNGLDALVSVSDPRSLVTGYAVDGLGNLNQQVSPDTGTTTNTYDTAGNLLTQTDAKGQVTAYAYDALNRVTLITFHDGSKQQYAYDAGSNGIGRLASITERDVADQQTNKTSYAYDQHGRVLAISTEHAGVIYNVGYTYDSAGRLSALAYPSGRSLSYTFDSLGRVNHVATTRDNQTDVVVQDVQYHPFGGVKSYTLGNGQVYVRGIDLDGRIASYTLGSQSFGIGYDAASRITFITDLANPANSNTYSYDALDRLTAAVLPGTPFAYAYDAVGNRTSKTVGSVTDAYTYSSTSNRIATAGSRSFMFDANGSTTADGNNTYAYDVRGRMVQATSVLGATSYRVNALGQRIRKTNSLGDTVFHYDTNGRLIAESDPGGGVKREILYLGDIPVGVVQ